MTAAPAGYTIRDLTDPFAIAPLETVQRLAWGYDDLEITPGSMLTVAAHTGGLVAAAYHQADLATPVAFVYGFPGLRSAYAAPLFAGQAVVHHSHMLAVVPQQRASGLASALKQHQRRFARAGGHDLMLWTMDPLLAKNARLNLGKLGAKAVAYYPNWYALRGGIYSGLPADRLLIAWDLRADPLAAPLPTPAVAGERVLEANAGEAMRGPGPLRQSDAPLLALEIPRNIEAIKQFDLAVAQAWRAASREALTHYFAQGYCASALASDSTGRVFYQLERLTW
jgi:predicted GNAT superfamily acetyltransferase